jgi:hypothetical protein
VYLLLRPRLDPLLGLVPPLLPRSSSSLPRLLETGDFVAAARALGWNSLGPELNTHSQHCNVKDRVCLLILCHSPGGGELSDGRGGLHHVITGRVF